MNPYQTTNRLQFFQPPNPAGLETNSPIMATNSPQNSNTIQGVVNGQSMAVPPDDIWMEYKTSEGKPYYYNKITKQASWTKGPSTTFSATTTSLTNSPNINGHIPGGVVAVGGNIVQQGVIFPGQPEVPGSIPLWRELRTADGKYYYYNSVTKVSQWLKPEGFVSTGPIITTGSVSLPSSTNTSTKSTVGQVNNKNGTSSLLEQCMEKTLQNLGKPVTEERTATPSSPGKSKNVKNLAAEKFKEFINEKYEHGRFKLDDNWNKVIRHLQTDCRWSIITKNSEKKHIFNIWKDQKAKEERESRRLGLRKNKDNLEKWLLDNPLLKPYMSFSKAEKVFASEPAWKAVTDVQDRKDIFRSAQDLMRNTFKKREEEQSRKNKDALLNVLSDIPEITYKTTWKEAQYFLSIDPTFKKNKNLLKMNKIDALEAFQDHIYNLEDEHEKEEARKNKEQKREERKVRDKYRALLDKLAGEGVITSLTYWSEIFATVSKHSCFEEMLKQTKLSPLDIFKCYVNELKESYDKDKSVIKRILEKANFTIEIDTDFETIKDLIVSDEKGQKANLSNVKMFFTSQKLRAEKRRQHAIKKEEKRLRKLENAFHKMLSSIIGEIDEKVVYENIVDKISNEEIFNDIESDEQRQQFFNSYIVKLTTSCGHNHSKQKESKKIKNKKLLKYQQLTDTDDSDGEEKRVEYDRKRPFQNGSPISSDDDEEPVPEKKEKVEVTDEDLSEGEIRD
ncbi:PRP40 pre-mRNA processing factor 40 homolog A [Strongyloides ratti]|uniref:PRP40 pre-mRNA processing factor 40 homolog A n=1 Tax=Strongyloides ratti TaxID=34506 RepID=A0A090MX77_STRRB|nr:PRP40 pre-mRNA processing factor 40 homolog A [Strongyloides ratti]CEF64954.1 PRP40 pre-mRNA processing factor 40 homolog A [Strongyloides ratti]